MLKHSINKRSLLWPTTSRQHKKITTYFATRVFERPHSQYIKMLLLDIVQWTQKDNTAPSSPLPCPQQVCWNWKCVLNEAASVTAGVAETFLHTQSQWREIPCWSLNMIPPRDQPSDQPRDQSRDQPSDQESRQGPRQEPAICMCSGGAG